MLKKMITGLLISLAVLTSPIVNAYEQALAESYALMFQPVTGAKVAKELHFMSPEAFLEKLKKGERFVVVDIRTEKESGIFTMVLPGSMRVPINKLFLKEQLDQLPTDKPIIIVCKSGARATAAGTALRHIGFDKTYILKGGFKALSGYVGPKEAYAPLKVKERK